MNFKQWAMEMYPVWILAIGVMCAVMSTKYKSLLRINKTVLVEWTKFLITVTIIRFCMYKLFPNAFIFNSVKHAGFLPWGVGFTVFWEDAVHGLPLLILRKLIGVNKWTRPLHLLLLSLVMLEFGIGHLYQGMLPALALSFYVPYSMKVAEKHGFGTVMIGHMLYDNFSLFFVRCLMGL